MKAGERIAFIRFLFYGVRMHPEKVKWRLIDTGPLDGRANMAVDEALLGCFDPESSEPVLRLYGWEPPALSLGRFQKAAEVLDRERCTAARVPVVKRITGGGAIYHAEELTYAIVCSTRHIPQTASVKDSFRVLTGFLLHFYRKLGMSPRYAADSLPSGTRFGERTAFCFAGRESYDILIEDRKIGGNAQRRQRKTIFQHGSIPLVNHAARGATFLRNSSVGAGETSAALRDEGVAGSMKELKGLLAEAFMEALPAVLLESRLSYEEMEVASRLAQRDEDLAIWGK